ncbi:MAG: hypothetical protein ACE15E_04075 [Acidobacteriota bacterium]
MILALGFLVPGSVHPGARRRQLADVRQERTEKPKPEKNIRLVRPTGPAGPFSAPSLPITGNYWAEGPTAIKVGEFWQVYFDKYRERRYGMVRSRRLLHPPAFL